MKETNISIKKVYVISGLITILLAACKISDSHVMPKENRKPIELNDYLELNKKEWVNLLSDARLTVEGLEIVSGDGSVALYFEGEQLEKVILWHKAGEEGIPWTVYGIEPGMDCEAVIEKLDLPGIKIVGHNLQFYATGIQLEDAGIKMLKWGADDPVAYVEAVFENNIAGFLGRKEFQLKEEEYSYKDTDKHIDIRVMYPVFVMENHTQVMTDLNHYMKEKAYDIVNQLRTKNSENIMAEISFEVTNIESESISVKWSGIYKSTVEEELQTALNCSIQNGCKVQKITDMDIPIKLLASEMSWRTGMETDVLEEQLMDGTYDFYVTPISLEIICMDEFDHYMGVSVMRSFR